VTDLTARTAVASTTARTTITMATVAELMNQNLFGVFNERDPERRARAAAAAYAEGVVFHDPEGSVTGREALDAKAQALLDRAPGFVFAARGPLYTSAGALGGLAWQFGPADGDPVATGMDIALVENGLIHTLHTVLDG
jgi:hypothetical protein